MIVFAAWGFVTFATVVPIQHRLGQADPDSINTALHRIALTQAHYHPDAREFLRRRAPSRPGFASP